MTRKMPIGIDDYKKVIEGGYVYVDRTLFIQEILEKGAEVILIPRPRRFGKTINMSMLRCFFEKTDEDLSHLFRPYKIWQTKYREFHGRYPVIFLTLKGIQKQTWDNAYQALQTLIAEEFRRHRYLLDSPKIFEEEKDIFRMILQENAKLSHVENSLKLLVVLLERHHGERVIVLLDEYDAPMHSAYFSGYFQPMASFMRNWLGGGLKSNPALERGVITGVLRIAKESIFSDLNHISNFTIFDSAFSRAFGFLEEEVHALLLEFGLAEELPEVRKWYNGYHIGSSAIYNPWSVLQYLDRKRLAPYWVNTSANVLINEQLTRKGLFLREDFESLLMGRTISKVVDESLVFADLDKRQESTWSLLLFSGYVTLDATPVVRGTRFSCTLKIPNEEILCLFHDIVEDYFRNAISGSWQNLLTTLTQGDVETFAALLQQIIMEMFSSHDLPQLESERIYHAFVMGLLASLRETHEIRSNRESGLGRYDACLFPKDPRALGILLEFKKGKEGENLDDLAQKALLQIEELQYTQELISRGIRKNLLLGIAFQGKILHVKHKFLHS